MQGYWRSPAALQSVQITDTQALAVSDYLMGSESLEQQTPRDPQPWHGMKIVPGTQMEAELLTLLSSSFASWKAFSLAALAISLPLCRSYSQKMTAEAVCTGKRWHGLCYNIGTDTVFLRANTAL